ncbi:hypothetical protein A2801_02925 [Candidatus Woesebacteria bacterium RIFCSPHIGHO2_01_FULL_41_10]|uniref:Phosphodiester glycosidase domain-containing protein n=1 Tax=Candidatus Woesebacteria bacterium RIFCSPHIGHO2_01_FULL_41_10 TaxID=1802500 RepID=A0A1F7YPQ3_9BACT|nr:MAG: hypothetical protein A2801_02925 [Candidatus Woesebacteria bacterium RIFCSPHIGHO2_01_FULL_41_10]
MAKTKKVFIGLFVLVIASLLLNASVQTKKEVKNNSEDTQVLGVENKLLISELTRDGITYISYLYPVENPNSLVLISNLDEQVTLRNFVESSNCEFVINGGFYSTTFSPIGYLLIDGIEENPYKGNVLFNGVLSINGIDTPRITRSVPVDPLRLAIQTGPILYENGKSLEVVIENDKPARRSFALITGSNNLYLGIILDTDSSFSGPLLAKLPALLNIIASEHQIEIADAINLDGGTASGLFYTSEDKGELVTELSTIGTFICVEK